MFQSNPAAVAAIVSLATVLLYERRYDITNAADWLIAQALNLLLFIRVFWWVPTLMFACYAIDRWLGWQWLLVGFGRALGASVIATCLWLFWVGFLLPKAQKLSRRWTR